MLIVRAVLPGGKESIAPCTVAKSALLSAATFSVAGGAALVVNVQSVAAVIPANAVPPIAPVSRPLSIVT